MIDYNNLVQLNTQLKQNPFASCITITEVKKGTIYFEKGNRTCTLEQLVDALNKEKGFVTNISLLKSAIESYNKQAVKKSKPQIKSKPDTNRPKNKNLAQIKRTLGKQMLMSNAKKVSIYEDNYVMVSTMEDVTIVYIPESFKADENFDWSKYGKWNHILWQKKLKIVDGKNIKSTRNMFYECHAQSIDLSYLDTSNVTNMHGMFKDCEAQSIDLSYLDTSNVTNMYGMFYECNAQSLNLSSFNTSKVTNMESMFYHCKSQAIGLSSFDTSKVTNMEHMFCGYHGLSIDLSSFDTSNVTNMHEMFWGCTAKVATTTDERIIKALEGTITRVENKNVIPNSSKQAVKNSKSDNNRLIGKQMLLSNAKKVFIYQNKYDRVSKKGDNYVMVSTKGDTTIVYIPETFKTDDNFNWDNSSDWDQLIIGPNIKKLKIIGGQNITSTKSMFWESSVESIDLSSFDTSNVTNMVCMFYACEAQSIDFSSFNTSKVTDMDGMFEWCKVPSLDLSSFDTSKVTDMGGMFMHCEAQYLNLSSFNTSKVTNMKDMFFDCIGKIIATDKRILQKYKNRKH